MHGLKQRVQGISDLLPPGSSVVYCDLPLFNNFGDILIMLGTVKFFESNGIRVRDSFGPFALSKSIKPYRGSTWILHGGGNFGDLYPEHQQRRALLIGRHPEARIISFPQTMHFSNAENLRQFARVVAAHKDIHLLWRDSYSYDMAERHFECKNYLVPDMAHFLWPIVTDEEQDLASGDLLLIRRDEESGAIPPWLAAREQEFTDWRDLIPFPHRQMRRLLTVSDVAGSVTGLNVATVEAWSAFCFQLLRKLAKVFRGRQRIITSRLHGHILACLLERRSLLLDNSYGKNRRYFQTWTQHLNLTELERG